MKNIEQFLEKTKSMNISREGAGGGMWLERCVKYFL